MVILKISFNALPEKYNELEQTLYSMSRDLEKMPGCQHAELWRDSKKGNLLYMASHWEDRQKLDDYLRMDAFSALMGSRILLATQPSIAIDSVMSQEGMEAVEKARSDSMGKSESDKTSTPKG